jgi:hypothetical protein
MFAFYTGGTKFVFATQRLEVETFKVNSCERVWYEQQGVDCSEQEWSFSWLWPSRVTPVCLFVTKQSHLLNEEGRFVKSSSESHTLWCYD